MIPAGTNTTRNGHVMEVERHQEGVARQIGDVRVRDSGEAMKKHSFK